MLTLLAASGILVCAALVIILLVIRPNPRPYGRRRRSLEPVERHAWKRPKPEWVRWELIRIQAQDPSLSCRRTADIFNRRHGHRGMTVGRTYVNETIRRHRYEIELERRKIRNRRLKAGPPKVCWGVDLTFKTDDLGNLHPILG